MNHGFIAGYVDGIPVESEDGGKVVTEFVILSGEGDSQFKTACIAYGKSAETAFQLKPGTFIVVQGQLEPKIVETELGRKNTFPLIRVSKVMPYNPLAAPPQATKTPQTTQARTRANTAPVGQPKSTPRSVPDYIDDIPF